MSFNGSAYGASTKYTDESLLGGGAIKGKNCTIQSIDKSGDTNTVTFSWTLDGGTVKTGTMLVKDGASIQSIAIDEDNHVIATLTDGTTIDGGEMPSTEVEISEETGNVLEKKDDGLYVAKGAVEISKAEGNTIESKADGLYVPKTDLSGYVEKEDDKSLVLDTDIAQITANKEAIETLNGDDTTVGSVAKQIKDAIGDITQFDTKVVDSLPATGVKGIIYFVPKAEATDPDVHDEYVWVGEKFELVGNTKVDLSDYVKKDGDKVLSTNDYTDEDKAEVGKVKDKVDIQQKAEDEGKALVVGADGKLTLGEVATSDIGSVELNMLGWNVPSELSLKNEVVGNKFIQKIARVDLGTLDWQYRSSDGLMLCQTPLESKAIAETDAPNIICSAYKALPRSGTESVANTDKSIALPNKYTIVHDSGYTDGTTYKTAIKGTYLYYELATPIEKVIEDNEILTEFNEKIDNEIAQKELELTELKMLGWTVPSEMPLKNEVEGNKFIQRVGRIDASILSWVAPTDPLKPWFATTDPTDKENHTDFSTMANVCLVGYEATTRTNFETAPNESICVAGLYVCLKDSNYTTADELKESLKGKYIYYELATPITTQIDGNEAIKKINDVLVSTPKQAIFTIQPTTDAFTDTMTNIFNKCKEIWGISTASCMCSGFITSNAYPNDFPPMNLSFDHSSIGYQYKTGSSISLGLDAIGMLDTNVGFIKKISGYNNISVNIVVNVVTPK